MARNRSIKRIINILLNKNVEETEEKKKKTIKKHCPGRRRQHAPDPARTQTTARGLSSRGAAQRRDLKEPTRPHGLGCPHTAQTAGTSGVRPRST